MLSTPLIILGAGRLGRTLVRQLAESEALHRTRHGVAYRVIAWADSTGALVRPEGFPFPELLSMAERKDTGHRFMDLLGEPGISGFPCTLPPAAFGASVVGTAALAEAGPSPIVVDLTSTGDTAPALLAALDSGYSVATANKLPLAADLGLFRRLTATPRFRYEATVASAVPVIEACLGLQRNGDQVEGFVGALSGTLGFISTGLGDGEAFSDLVRTAMSRGYTEKDPRVDLGGMDVARKALILARTLGLSLELSDIALEPLVPAAFAALPLKEFLDRLPELDAPFRARVAEAEAEGCVARYFARLAVGRIEVGLGRVAKGSALGSLRGNDNLLAITSSHYPELPLVLQGRGRGVEAAAAGVHGDIVALAMLDGFRRP